MIIIIVFIFHWVNVFHDYNMAFAIALPPDRANERLATSDAAWQPTTSDEMKVFIAINMVMGLKNCAEYRDFWLNDAVLHDHFISQLITRNRYEKLAQYHHCALTADEDATDRLTKVRPLIVLCQQNFERAFGHSRDLSVDEAMVAFNGWLSFFQAVYAEEADEVGDKALVPV